MKKVLLALVLLGGVASLSGCAWMTAHNPYKWGCDKIHGTFDPATGDCAKNLFG